MIGAIIEIIIGIVIWQVVPGWITEGSKGAHDIIKLVCHRRCCHGISRMLFFNNGVNRALLSR